MPHLINSPEAWFREQKRDFYQLDFDLSYEEYQRRGDDAVQAHYKAANREVDIWFERQVPSHTWLRFGPSEYSGYMSGGPPVIGIELSEAQAEAFCSEWKDHPYWRLILRKYADWRAHLDSFKPWVTSHPIPKRTHWFYSTAGHFSVLSKQGDPPEPYAEQSYLSEGDHMHRIIELLGPCNFNDARIRFGDGYWKKHTLHLLESKRRYLNDLYSGREVEEDTESVKTLLDKKLISSARVKYGVTDEAVAVKLEYDDW